MSDNKYNYNNIEMQIDL